MNLIVDTNIVLYVLGGNEKLARLLDKTTIHIPFIVEIELLSHSGLKNQELKLVESFIEDSIRIPYTETLKDQVIKLRRNLKIKTPDAFVAASSLLTEFPLISADKDFKKIHSLNLLEFKL